MRMKRKILFRRWAVFPVGQIANFNTDAATLFRTREDAESAAAPGANIGFIESVLQVEHADLPIKNLTGEKLNKYYQEYVRGTRAVSFAEHVLDNEVENEPEN